ncbi:MAG: phytoene desaturase [Spirochaetes bacterium]|nr:phytoene desaturase [Spirochaetota bacterium]
MNSRAKKTAIVVGAGLGGIAAAALLAKRGHAVTLFEKNDYAGGRCATVTHRGFRFDVGATLFLMPESFRALFTELGERMEDHLELTRVDPASEVHFHDGTSIKLTGDLLGLREETERFERGSFPHAMDYLRLGHDCYHRSLEALINRDFRHWYQFFTPKNIALFLRVKAFSDLYRIAAHHFTDPRLRAAFSYHSLYVGLNPYGASGMYTMLPALEIIEGLYYPKGGMASIARALLSIAEKNGVRFKPNTPVERIAVANGKASGVQTNSGVTNADIVVVNADAPYAYKKLLGEKIRPLKYSCSAYTFYWGINGRLDGLTNQHNVFVAKDYRKELVTVFNRNAFAPEGHFYLNLPSRTDPKAAPKGKDTIMVIVPCGHTVTKQHRDWEKEQAAARSWVLKRLSGYGVANLEKRIVHETAYTPKDWESFGNLTGGAVFGSLNHSLMQMGYFRMHNRHRRYRNLFFVGGSTAPGSGLPMVLIGARLAVKRIDEEMN